MKYFKVGFIGSGRMATEHVKVLKYFNNYNVVAVCSKNPRNAKKFANKFNIPNYYKNINKFLSQNKYDLVIVCVPPNEKFKIIKLIASKNINIFMEKPLGLNYKDGERILNYCKKVKFKKNFFIGYNRRYLGSTVKLYDCLRNNNNIRNLLVEDQQDTEKAKKIGHKKIVINNWMFANSIHLIDLINYFCRGKVINIKSSKIKFSKKSYVIFSRIKFSSGDKCIYIGKWNIKANWSLYLDARKENFLLNPLEELKILNKSLVKVYKNFKMEKNLKPGFFNQFKEIDKILNNKYGKIVKIKDALKSVNLIKRIYQNV